MKVYHYTGSGVVLGSVIVVVADDGKEARKLARQWASRNSVDPDSLRLDVITPAEFPMVVYAWDGDY